jgi:antirestriction protein ArdC
MSEEERAKYNVYPKLQVFNVFNLDQTNLREARPEMYEKYASESQGLVESSDKEMESFPAIDAMIEKDLWVCPIKPVNGDSAYYSPSRDVIVIPEKKQFMDGESFYSNLLHEMSHSTGSQSRLDRLKPGQSFGSKEYAREELVAELTAALVSSQYGMTKHVKSDSAAYLKSWLNNLQEDPSFIKSTLLDVKRSASFIGQRVDAVNMRIERDGVNADFADIREQNKLFSSSFSTTKSEGQAPAQESKPEQTETKPQEQEQVAARGVDPPRFHR